MLGKQGKECREKFGYSQGQLAELANVSRQTIDSLETGKYNPSIFLAHKLSKTFHVSIEELFLFEEDK
ncbi:MAG: helix-turn-helix transcriptional regulator [Clostridiales bacterium]|nr:helix-turn-helix transcriptional regulator [Clostridiales bacterium]MCI2191451.1 helix-turn-helix transcriptional regulator [Oscillospiraceae bacterium]MCI1962337.1 helix-turn-helix transcriptional regulator [Clostridiales bacterium]MCI2022851.1 helix-turn-helix transcriptional regulator [Clostridiales bacterium]MCI2027248.1 helix-turn-helix transcriptional regulator [Clostridiales bacterium]